MSVKNKFTSILLSLCMLASFVPVNFTAFASDEPELINGAYQIESAEDLVWFAEKVNGGDRTANAVLNSDIDLENKNWTPIGNGYNYINNNGYGIDDDTAYNGIFDGKGHSISRLFIETKKYNKQGDNHYETYCQGLFGIIGKEGTVRNVTVNGQINAQAEGNEYINAAKYIGGIAGINAGLIINCTNNVDITGLAYVGGITGQLGAQFKGSNRLSGNLINVTNNGTVTATSKSFAEAGGIVGQLAYGDITYAANHGNVSAPFKDDDMYSYLRGVAVGGIVGKDISVSECGKIDRAYNDGQIGTEDGNYFGGIIGCNYACDITNVYNTGKVIGYNYSGGLVGYKLGGTIENAYNSGEVNTHTEYQLIGSMKNTTVNNLYNIGDSTKLVALENGGDISTVYAVDTVLASDLSDAFTDSDNLPVIDWSNAPTGEDETFDIESINIENGKITVLLNKKLVGTNPTLNDFEIKSFVDDKAVELKNVQLSQYISDEKTAIDITFDKVNAEKTLKISVNGIEKQIVTYTSNYWIDYRAEEFDGGNGDKDNPYVIANAEELALLSYEVEKGNDMSDKYFVLKNDIDLSGKEWTPIGVSDKYISNKYQGNAFNGNFNGQDNSIRGINISSGSYLSALFGVTEENAVIKNLYVYGNIENTNNTYGIAAGICAVNYGLISHCINYAEIKGENRVGGIVGYNGAVNKTVTSCVIAQCENKGTITGKDEVGGIAAYSSGTVKECTNKATVTATDGYAGGIVGYNYEGSILLDSCYNSGEVSASAYSGGISGKSYNCDISNSYNSGKISSQNNTNGGILGYTVSGYSVKNCYFLKDTAPMPYAENSGTGLEVKTENQLADMTGILGSAFVKSDKFPVLAWEVNGSDDIDTSTKPTPSVTPASTPKIEEKIPSYSSQGKWSDSVAETFDSGNGSKENPYVIKTASELALLAKNVNKGESYKDAYFKLNNNIDLTEKYWISIGNAEDKAFSGHFNGNGYEVKLNTENQKVSGLFGYTANAEITLLGVDGLVSGEDIGGGIVGIARDTKIENCYSNTAVLADEYVGGLVGQLLSGSKVTNCYATGTVKAKKAGTLFGAFTNGVSAENLYYRIIGDKMPYGENASTNTNIATGRTDEYMQSDAFVYDLWCVKEQEVDGKTVEVAPIFYVGSKYPVLNNEYKESKIISINLVSSGESLETDTSHTFTAKIYGKNLNKNITAKWSSDNSAVTVEQSGDITITNGVGTLNVSIIIDSAKLGNAKDITVKCEIGGISSAVSVKVSEPKWSGKGTEEEPYIIKSLEDMNILSESVADGNSYKGVYFKLSSDIDLSDSKEFSSIGYWDGLKSNDNGEWWESEKNRAFEGVFDGNGFSVKNAILYAENNYFGLFSYIGKNGVVKNLNIDSTNRLTAHNNVRKIAALAGINLGTIENCTNSADFGFTASNVTYLAGIVGENYGIVTGCVNNSNMTSAGNSKSGIVGENYGTIRKSENNGDLSNSGNVGGITIENRNGKGQALLFIDDYADLSVNGEISECVNNGAISGKYDVGGIVAENYSCGKIENCANTAEVSGSMTGGIAGRASGCYKKSGIKNCQNSGNITAQGSYGGGIVGELINGLVYFCENTGDVNGENYAGGIVGRNYSSTVLGESAVDFSNNYGTVTAKTSAGICGYYQDESGKCYTRYNYNGGKSEYGVFGDVNSNYDINSVVCENYWLSDDKNNANDSCKGDIDGINAITKAELDKYSAETVNLQVDNSDIIVNGTANVSSNSEVKSSDENIVSIGNGVAVGHGIGQAYLYAKSSPYTYVAVLMNVEENPDNVEKINVSFRLIGEENLGSDFVLTKDTKNTYQTWIPEKEYEVKLGSTVGDVFKQALDDNGLKYRGWENGYISTIQSPEGYWLGEFTNGKYSGWMYTVNGSHPSLGLNEYKLIGDEEIVWHYVDDYRQEVADWSESDKTGDGSLYNRWLDAKDTDSTPKPTSTVTPTATKQPQSGGSGSGGSTSTAKPTTAPTVIPTTAPEKDTTQTVWFTDVTENMWFYQAVKYAYDKGFMTGVSDSEFAPDITLTRAMFVSVLYRIENEPTADGELNFSDVSDDSWYAKAVLWAYNNDIISGKTETEFDPNSDITREQMAAILYRYAKTKEYNLDSDEITYSDVKDIADYATDSVKWAYCAGIMTGDENGNFNPKSGTTRAQAASVFMRLYK